MVSAHQAHWKTTPTVVVIFFYSDFSLHSCVAEKESQERLKWSRYCSFKHALPNINVLMEGYFEKKIIY